MSSTTSAAPAAAGVQISARSGAGFTCELRHGPSGSVISTVAPKDNGGTGATFSPTDLLASALLTCALTTMALVGGREGIAFGEASGEIEKHMTPPPRRVGRLPILIRMPAGLSAAARTRLEEIAHGCPVARSLSSEVEVSMRFEYPDAAK